MNHDDHGGARISDPGTSHVAAASVNVTKLYGVIQRALREHGPMTTEEIARATGEDLQSITPRMKPMEEAGLAIRTDKRRRGSTGRSRIVWALP